VGVLHGHIGLQVQGGVPQYDDDANVFFHPTGFMDGLSRELLIEDECACVHELTHAVYDAHNLGKRPGEESEIIAYTAEYLFRVNSGYPCSTETSIVTAAGALARFLCPRPGFELRDGMARELATAILASPRYRDIPNHAYWSNGIPNVPMAP